MTHRTPLILITGSLGSGKTTLLQRVIATHGPRLAVLINEFGEIGIDSRIIQGEHLRLIELAGGCVCCELAGEFVAAVNELLDKYQPEMLVLEATGVAEADALVYEVEDDLPRVRLECVICIVDGWADTRYPQIGYVSRLQLQQADIILINKSDLISAEQLAELREKVRSYNSTAAIIATERCAGVEALLFAEHRGSDRPAAAANPLHGAGLQSFTFTTTRPLAESGFTAWAATLGPEVFRVKGFVLLEGGRSCLFNFVAGRWELEPFETTSTQLVFIGSNLGSRQDAITKGLKLCEQHDGLPLS